MTQTMKIPRIPRADFLKLGLAAVLSPVFACSPEAMPISRSSNDPSSPRAPAGVSPMIAAAAHGHHAPSADGAEVYVCPMHPEVTSTKAGELCPKCNMKLVPKK